VLAVEFERHQSHRIMTMTSTPTKPKKVANYDQNDCADDLSTKSPARRVSNTNKDLFSNTNKDLFSNTNRDLFSNTNRDLFSNTNEDLFNEAEPTPPSPETTVVDSDDVSSLLRSLGTTWRSIIYIYNTFLPHR